MTNFGCSKINIVRCCIYLTSSFMTSFGCSKINNIHPRLVLSLKQQISLIHDQVWLNKLCKGFYHHERVHEYQTTTI